MRSSLSALNYSGGLFERSACIVVQFCLRRSDGHCLIYRDIVWQFFPCHICREGVSCL